MNRLDEIMEDIKQFIVLPPEIEKKIRSEMLSYAADAIHDSSIRSEIFDLINDMK